MWYLRKETAMQTPIPVLTQKLANGPQTAEVRVFRYDNSLLARHWTAQLFEEVNLTPTAIGIGDSQAAAFADLAAQNAAAEWAPYIRGHGLAQRRNGNLGREQLKIYAANYNTQDLARDSASYLLAETMDEPAL
jgi:hypothetical protein